MWFTLTHLLTLMCIHVCFSWEMLLVITRVLFRTAESGGTGQKKIKGILRFCYISMYHIKKKKAKKWNGTAPLFTTLNYIYTTLLSVVIIIFACQLQRDRQMRRNCLITWKCILLVMQFLAHQRSKHMQIY